MNATDRLEALEDALLRLRQAAMGACVVVEGRNDVAALEDLGVGGAHRVVHRGAPLQVVVDELAEEAVREAWPRVILLLDWDRTGGRLFRVLHDGLQARVSVDADRRRELAAAAHCKCIEDVPAELSALRRQSV